MGTTARVFARAVVRMRLFFAGPAATAASTRQEIVCARCGAGADVIACRTCKQSFELQLSTRSWFAERGMSAPTRCPTCRKKRRKAPAALPKSKGTGGNLPPA